MNTGMVALMSIAGLGWLGSSFFEGNKQVTVVTFMPAGVALGLGGLHHQVWFETELSLKFLERR